MKKMNGRRKSKKIQKIIFSMIFDYQNIEAARPAGCTIPPQTLMTPHLAQFFGAIKNKLTRQTK